MVLFIGIHGKQRVFFDPSMWLLTVSMIGIVGIKLSLQKEN